MRNFSELAALTSTGIRQTDLLSVYDTSGGIAKQVTLVDLQGAKEFATRAEAVTYAAQETVPDGQLIVAAGYLYRGKTAATDIADLLGVVPVEPVYFEHFGAVGDGTTDDMAALDEAFDWGGVLNGTPGATYLVDQSGLKIHSSTTVIGATFKAGANLGLGDTMIDNANGPTGGARVDSDIRFVRCVFDGAGRTYISYPTSGYDTRGNMVRLKAVTRPAFLFCELKNHQSQGISDQGSKDALYLGCQFHDNGKGDSISSPLYIASRGIVRKILNITLANPGVVTMDDSADLSNGDTVKIKNVQGMASVPDGDYTVANVSGATFELSGVNTTTDAGYQENGLAYVGHNGGTSNVVWTERALVANCHFYDNNRSAISFIVESGTITGCRFNDNGESTLFCNRTGHVVITNNEIDGTTLTDIIAACVEVNNAGPVVITGNQFANSATRAISVNGCTGGVISDNLFRDIVKDNTVVYPTGPLAVAAGIDGTTITKTEIIKLSNLGDFPCANMRVSGNIVVDHRTTAQASSGVIIAKAGSVNDNTYNVAIHDNDFVASGLTAATMVVAGSDSVCLPYTMNVYRNMGHGSEHAYETELSIAATGDQTLDMGFVPRVIEFKAFQNTGAHVRESHGRVVRDRTNITAGSLGRTFSRTLDNVTGTITSNANKNTGEVVRLFNGAGTLQFEMDFKNWEFENTNGIGVTFNVGTANITGIVQIIAHP